MSWNYIITGKIHKMDLKIAKVNRHFKLKELIFSYPYNKMGFMNKELQDAVIRELSKRKDKGYPWFGDSVTVITPHGSKLDVFIPHPEDRQMELFNE